MSDSTPQRPLVSICLPNLNTRPFLEERISTVLAQTYTNWELVVSDNFSEDGAWQFFTEQAEKDPRILIAQAPREGMYANWNRCVERAQGEFIYVATSDDLMPPNCLHELVDALVAHPECDIAHCPLWVMDEHGAALPAVEDWWWQKSLFAESAGRLVDQPHVRFAPYTGLLHLMGSSVNISMTQLLIRRSLFDRIGLFEAEWGSVGDFNWNMRAGLVANTVHVPGTRGGWRLHASQATAAVAFKSPEFAQKVDAMIAHAVRVCAPMIEPSVRAQLESVWVPHAREMREYLLALRSAPSLLGRYRFLLSSLLSGSTAAREHLRLRLLRRPMHHWLLSALEEVRPGRPTVQPAP